MTTAPALVTTAATTWGRQSGNPNTKTTSVGGQDGAGTITWQAGDFIVVTGGTELAATPGGGTLSVPTGTGLSFTEWGSAAGSGSQSWGHTWSASPADGGSSKISVTHSNTSVAQAFGIRVWVWRGSDGRGNRATAAGTTAQTVSLARTYDNSNVCEGIYDYNVRTPGTTWTPAGVNVRDSGVQDGGASYSIATADWGDQGTAGTLSYGTTNWGSSPLNTILAVEVRGGAGGTPASPTAAVAAATGAAYQPTVATGGNASPTAPAAAAGGAAYQPSVAAQRVTAPTAGLAAGTSTAYQPAFPVPADLAGAGYKLSLAAGSSTPGAVTWADDGANSFYLTAGQLILRASSGVSVSPTAGAASASGTAYQPQVLSAPATGLAAATGAAYQPSVATVSSASPTAGLAVGTGTAYPAVLTRIHYRGSYGSAGTGASATVTLPTGWAAGDLCTIALTVGVTGQDPAATGWTTHHGDGTGYTWCFATRVLQGGDANPVFSWVTTATWDAEATALAPDTGYTLSVADQPAEVSAGPGTQVTPPSGTAAAGSTSLLLVAGRAADVQVPASYSMTSPAGWITAGAQEGTTPAGGG